MGKDQKKQGAKVRAPLLICSAACLLGGLPPPHRSNPWTFGHIHLLAFPLAQSCPRLKINWPAATTPRITSSSSSTLILRERERERRYFLPNIYLLSYATGIGIRGICVWNPNEKISCQMVKKEFQQQREKWLV